MWCRHIFLRSDGSDGSSEIGADDAQDGSTPNELQAHIKKLSATYTSSIQNQNMSQQQVLVPIMTPLSPCQIIHNQHRNNYHSSSSVVTKSKTECGLSSGKHSSTTPATLVRSLLFSGKNKRALSETTGRTPTTMSTADEDQVAAYDHDVARAIRSNDLDQLRDYLEDGRCFTGCNRNGETLLHLACRRSDWQVVEFLIDEAGVSTDGRDTLGRSCLHDCAWRPVPSFPLMNLLLRNVSPWMLVEADCRGHTCLDYVRPGDYDVWNAYLLQSSGMIQRRAQLVSRLLLAPLS